MKEIHVHPDLIALVDDEDFENLLKYSWWLLWRRPGDYKRYAFRTANSKTVNGHRESAKIAMHREILNAQAGQQVDHIDGDGLNNQRSNLRLCTASGNARNRKNNLSSKTPYKGVRESRGKFRAYIRINGKQKDIATFDTPEDAATAYNFAAEEHFGEFARYNLPQDKRLIST